MHVHALPLHRRATVKYSNDTAEAQLTMRHLPDTQSMPTMLSTEYYAYPVKYLLDRYLHPQDIDRVADFVAKIYRSAHRKLYNESRYKTLYSDSS